MATYTSQQLQPPSPQDDGLVVINHITYALYLLSYFTAGLSWLVAIIINYIKRDDARGTWLKSHIDWQIKTFWYTIFMVVISILLIVFIGLPAGLMGAFSDDPAHTFSLLSFSGLLTFAGVGLWVFVLFWHLYRIIRGWVALASRKPVP